MADHQSRPKRYPAEFRRKVLDLVFWGHHLVEQLRRPTMDRDFGLKLRDAPASYDQFGVLAAGRTGQLASVDQMLSAPEVDRLLANAQVGRDLSYRTARGDGSRRSR